MDLTKALLPDAIDVSGSFYKIHTGHSYWFRFAEIMSQEKKFLHEFDYIYIGDDRPEDRQAGVNAMLDFYHKENIVPRSEGAGERVIDYQIDADLIYSGILQCYGIDLYDKQYHWHKVRAMIAGLNNTKLNDVIGYRASTDIKNKEMQRMKRVWALPEKETLDDKAARDRFNSQFE